MTRPDYCPIGGEPCQSMCATPCAAQPAPAPVAWHCQNDPDSATAFFWRRTSNGKCPNCSKALVPVYLGAAPAA